MKPAILVLTSTFPRNEDDHEPRFIADLCLHLKDDFDIHVLTQHRPGTRTEEDANGLQVKRFRYAPEGLEILSESGGILNTLSSKPLAWCLVPGFIFAQVFAIREIIKAVNPVVIHAHWLVPQSLSAVLCQKFLKTRVPIVSTSHGGDLYGLKNKFIIRLKRWAIQSSDRLSVVSSAMRDYVHANLDIEKTRIAVCPMGADLDITFIPDPAVTRVSGQLVFVGRLVNKKGLVYLLSALKLLQETEVDVQMIIAGYGPEESSLKQQARQLGLDGRVTFLGSLSHKQAARLYAESEMCVLPFIESENGDLEGLPVVAVEAMGCMCPVIVGDIPGINDLVTDGDTGLICNSTSPEDIAVKIKMLHDNPELRDRLSQNAYNSIQKKYSWTACAENYNRLLRAVIDTEQTSRD